jgi:hypothetical protein
MFNDEVVVIALPVDAVLMARSPVFVVNRFAYAEAEVPYLKRRQVPVALATSS